MAIATAMPSAEPVRTGGGKSTVDRRPRLDLLERDVGSLFGFRGRPPPSNTGHHPR